MYNQSFTHYCALYCIFEEVLEEITFIKLFYRDMATRWESMRVKM
jgi:hypothetical protein